MGKELPYLDCGNLRFLDRATQSKNNHGNFDVESGMV